MTARSKTVYVLVVVLLNAGAVTSTLAGSLEQWVGSGPDFNQVLNQSLYLTLPLAAFTAGFPVATVKVDRLLPLFSSFPNGRLRLVLRAVAGPSLLFPPTAAMVAGVFAVDFRSYGFAGGIDPSFYLVYATSTVAAALFGAAGSVALPSFLGPPLTAVLLYVLNLVPRYQNWSRLGLIIPAQDVSLSYLTMPTWPLAVKALAYLGTAGFIVLFVARAPRRWRRVSGVVALSAAASVCVLGPSGQLPRNPRLSATACGPGPIQVCSTVLREPQQRTVSTWAAEALRPFRNTAFADYRYVAQDNAETPGPGRSLSVSFAGTQYLDTALVDRTAVIQSLLPGVLGDSCPSADPYPAGLAVRIWYYQALGFAPERLEPGLSYTAPSQPVDDAARWLGSLPEAGRARWLTAHARAYRTCALRLSDFGTR